MNPLENVEPPKVKYFTTYHFARDLYGSLVPFTFFLVLSCFLFSWPQQLITAMSKIPKEYFTGFALLLFPLYIFTGAMSGIVADRFFMLPFFRKRFSTGQFEKLYEESRQQIEDIYKDTFAGDKPLTSSRDTRLGRKIDRVILVLRHYNPESYNTLYRYMTFLFLYRQSIIYVFLILVAKIWVDIRNMSKLSFDTWQSELWTNSPELLTWIALMGLCFVLVYSHQDGIRLCIRHEFDFIVSTRALLKNERQTGPTANSSK